MNPIEKLVPFIPIAEPDLGKQERQNLIEA